MPAAPSGGGSKGAGSALGTTLVLGAWVLILSGSGMVFVPLVWAVAVGLVFFCLLKASDSELSMSI